MIFQHTAVDTQATAIVAEGSQYTYGDLEKQSAQMAAMLLLKAKENAPGQIAFMVDPGFDYVAVLWGIWKAGGMAVPLCLSYPLPSLQYVLEDAAVSQVVVSPTYAKLLEAHCADAGITMYVLGQSLYPSPLELPELSEDSPALMLYTSGTTNLPKGVVLTHANLKAQVEILVGAWQWTSEDHILCVLPLHHVHGVVNVVGCALYVGAKLTFLPQFSPEAVFRIFREDRLIGRVCPNPGNLP
jgi:malonyl-CoA/methylmalonyl-CoA synthetase